MFSRGILIPSLETIVEESPSFVSSAVSIKEYRKYSLIDNFFVDGLISARSIPTVDVERRRLKPVTRKPPIEVRFLDGSKRFIPPAKKENRVPVVVTIITAEDLDRLGFSPSESDSSRSNSRCENLSSSSSFSQPLFRAISTRVQSIVNREPRKGNVTKVCRHKKKSQIQNENQPEAFSWQTPSQLYFNF